MISVPEYLYSILSGVDPLTGEVVELQDPEVSKAILELALLSQDNLTYRKEEPRNQLGFPTDKIFKELRTWRNEVADVIALPPYCIFSNRELRAIAEGDIARKEDLILIKGISKGKYDLYAEAIFAVIQSALNEEDVVPPQPMQPKSTEEKNLTPLEERIYIELRRWRLEEAKGMGLPAYYVFANKTLRAIATRDISCKEDLHWIEGIGPVKYNRYAEDLYEIIRLVKAEDKDAAKTPENLLEEVQSASLGTPLQPVPRVEISLVKEPAEKQAKRENCVDYRRGNCNGMRCICEDYEAAYDITEEEKALWPEYGDATAPGREVWFRRNLGIST